jgi:hypothetical protein
MVDAAYYRRQAATCRSLAGNSTQKERCLLDLADHFERRASEIEARRTSGKREASPGPSAGSAPQDD